MSSLSPHSPNTETDCTVEINGTRIPVADVDIHIRNEGPMDMGYYAEGQFASPYEGEDYLQAFNIEDENSPMDVCYIRIYRDDLDGYVPAFRGLVTGVGNAGGDTPESIWKFRARGPAFFLDKIPVAENFSGPGVRAIAELIVEQLNEDVPLSVSLNDSFTRPTEEAVSEVQDTDDSDGSFEVSNLSPGTGLLERQAELLDGARSFLSDDDDEDSTLVADNNDGGGGILVQPVIQGSKLFQFIEDEQNNVSRKTFTRNRHTLADVVSWITETKDLFLYFAPRHDRVKLQVFPQQELGTHDAHYLGGEVNVVDNNALSEVNPINTLTLNAKAANTLGSVGGFEVQAPDDEFVQVTARHGPLYRRAGETALHDTVFTESSANTKDEAEKEVRKRLYNRITNATEGDMTTLLYHPITPHDSITALPTCRSTPATDTEPITYNVTRVHHQIRASGISKTRLNVGVGVENGDIEIVNSTYKEK
ncbi:hypothetical protein GRX03_03410 [Halovenus sp. WSH3]|uniref:Uncharacterized protein n=1 Tax=Halovenus carboxidivorans TaxID=2692199 RepID=A0A6B0T099_9EURY|nr:hypothetical protein [Halovenus carboxidivorans]MXR50657.1 hypothetical protein [Halovenus carboxidivorans]